MDRNEAERLLEDVEVVPLLQLPIEEAKEILYICLQSEIPALLGRDDHCVKGCAPKLLLLARPEDAPRVAVLLRQRFGALLEQEGTLDLGQARGGAGETSEGALPCPACGAGIPDDVSECPDCGLGIA